MSFECWDDITMEVTLIGLLFSYSIVTWLLESGSIPLRTPDFLSSAINLKIL